MNHSLQSNKIPNIEEFYLKFGMLKKSYALIILKEFKTELAKKKSYTGHIELISEINVFTDELKPDKINLNIEQMDSKLDDLEKRTGEFLTKNHVSNIPNHMNANNDRSNADGKSQMNTEAKSSSGVLGYLKKIFL